MIPHSRPHITQDDAQAVLKTVESALIASGDKVARLESGLAAYLGRRASVAVSNGTSALYCALSTLGVVEGDDVIIPAYVCSSLLYAVRMTGAKAVVADSGHDLFHMDADTIKPLCTQNTKAIIFPHMFGSANDLTDIVAFGIPVIEDCALSLGSSLNGIKTGALGSFAAVCSFYATKVIASGEGGAVISDDDNFLERVRDIAHYADKIDEKLRFNFALSDISAALALSQLSRIDSMIDRRRTLAHQYSDALKDSELVLPHERDGEQHIFYRYVIGTENVQTLRDKLLACGVGAERPVFTPLSRYPDVTADCPRAEEAWGMSLSIPLYPALTTDEAATITESLVKSVK